MYLIGLSCKDDTIVLVPFFFFHGIAHTPHILSAMKATIVDTAGPNSINTLQGSL